MKTLVKFIIFLFLNTAFSQLQQGFVYVKEVIPNIEVELRYYSNENFLGRRVDGYEANKLLLTKETAEALKLVQEELNKKGLSLKVFDGYRPQTAVNHFIRWAKDLNDTLNKSIYYPDVKKRNLFKEEYIAARSGHSKGSTVDLTIIDTITCEPLDMGSVFDFFGMQSWVKYDKITQEQRSNRKFLQAIMLKYGFKNYPKEWWHFTLKDEPYPKTYFDFPVK
ncbi:M15 family metallopeptidase [Seonamhaeicola sp. ML3]|uniref:M15 family metallopeptidase n=1 Tax=Seonamhaeicola sp. ML3 TaxID=2937786 RepID=UPI00200F702D|nr:M15 family metallopeptidase [Seonamhaeicola sp. ML3]